MNSSQLAKPRIGISACLLGAEVRFNGGHKASALCMDSLAAYVEFVPVCPEVAIGLGIPRAPIRLVGDPAAPRAVGSVERSLDVTEDLAAYGERMAGELDDLCGFIFMQQSPSCGLHRVKVYQDHGRPSEPKGRGIFAEAFCRLHPDLPVEEDGRLNDPALRENFLARVFAYAQWQALLRDGLTRKALIDFHARHKYLLMATDPRRYKTLGRMLGNLADEDLQTLAPRYFSTLMTALGRCATRGTHSNVLQHLSGYFKRSMSRDDRHELQRLIDQYREGIIPLVVPLTLLKHHLRHHPDAYLARQVYLQPHPENLALRNRL
ncbi:YbgA family protein [Pseudomonas sp.]|uniref:YbgA family protein n=1 Tax=Pseudomonas sp. TaxID=306 RepID=UPI003D0A6DBC